MRGRAGALAALFFAALALRPQLVGAGPLFPAIQDDLETAHAVTGLLGTIPVLCMGLFALPAAFVLGRVGSRSAIAWCLGLIAAFGVGRVLAPDAALVIALTFPVGVGMGVAGALLPVAVKERFPDRPAFATGVYTTGIQLGSALSSALAVPVAHAAGGWRVSLFSFSALTAGLLLSWLLLMRGEQRHERVHARPPRLPWRSPLAWLLVVVFTLMGVVYYGINSWLPESYVERGWSEGDAGALLGVLNTAALPASILVPLRADRSGSRRRYLVVFAGVLLAALLGLVLVPGLGYVWAALVGVSTGSLFALVLTLPLDIAHEPARVGALVGMMLGVGYSLAAVSPFALGAVRDVTGSFTAALWLLVAGGAVILASCTPLSRERLRPRQNVP